MKTCISFIALAAVVSACGKTVPENTSSSTEGITMTTSPIPSMSAPSAAQVPSSGAANNAATAATAANAANAANAKKEPQWTAPQKWTLLPNTSQMRKATYKIPRATGDTDDGELSVIAASGGVEPNIQRWAGQFAGATPKTESRTPNGLKVTVTEMKGTYSGGMGGGAPKDHYMLLAAIVDNGDDQWFFKATGPEKTMLAAKPDFDAFVASLK